MTMKTSGTEGEERQRLNGSDAESGTQSTSSGTFSCKGIAQMPHLRFSLIISMILNVLILAAMCAFVAERFVDKAGTHSGCDKTISTFPVAEKTKSTHPPDVDVDTSQDFFQCNPCELMRVAADISYESINGSTICCKRMDRTKYQEPNRGSILSQCAIARDPLRERPALLLLYSKGCSTCKEDKRENLAWKNPNTVTSTTSYKKGNVDVDYCTGEITINEDGLYGVYSYIQFNSYTVDVKDIMNKDAMVYQIIFNTRTNQMLQFSRFTLEKNAYTRDQIGPVILPLKASDKLVVKTNYEKYIQPESTVFGLYKLG